MPQIPMLSLQDVCLELAKEEAAECSAGHLPNQKVSMTGFLVHIQEKRNALQRQITNWRQAQVVYTPHAVTTIAQTSPQPDDSQAELAKNVPLHLPSSFPNQVCSLSEMKHVCGMERRLRYTQAHDTLAQIRRQRRIIQGLWQFKKINVSGTGNRPNTRLLTTYKGLSRKVTRAAHKYWTAVAALRILNPEGEWREELKELRREDIHGPGKDPEESNGHYVMSWIWATRKADTTTLTMEAKFNECMCVEWTKARARMMRWQEEYAIIQEEMRRVVMWFEWKAECWVQQAARRENTKPDILRGVSAYTYKQADLMWRMVICCTLDWLLTLANKKIQPLWGAKYATEVAARQKKRAETKENVAQGDDVEVLDHDDGLDIEEMPSDIEDDEGVDPEALVFDFNDD
ncbi:hypothetical protein CVT25_004689 [Psilocybe cyanescens]|uniref:Uncharacterized protein n=1 Tax=Psilocybe cyanescens TaxID=93625 RepID=A0A409W316_PSICY|nr:hypothetical protein CVT25_004689 [Psilocybe cyanescens]